MFFNVYRWILSIIRYVGYGVALNADCISVVSAVYIFNTDRM